MSDDVAVIVISYNMAKMLEECIGSLLRQTFSNFRLIIIDDASSDETEETVRKFFDKRIYYKRNDKRLGIAASRNVALTELKDDKIVFFIDADCYVEPDWIEEGMKAFDLDPSVVAIEGVTAYGGYGYRPRLSEKSYHMDCKLGMCQTHNCAYRIEVFKKIGSFDEEAFNYLLEDTDFFYRAKKAFQDKKFLIWPKMKVVHQKTLWTISKFFMDTYKVKYFVRIIKKHGRQDFGAGRIGSFILSPKNFILALFPASISVYILAQHRRICDLYDALFILLYIAKAYHYRLLVWYYAIKERVLVF